MQAATYEFMKYNSWHGGESYFYSFEYEGENSIWNLLFSAGGGGPPLPHGCTHADDLIYIFSTGLFERKGDDMKIVEDFSYMWTEFAKTGKVRTRDGFSVPPWTESDPRYVKLDVRNEIMYDFIYTWNNPNRYDMCQNLEIQ